MRTGGCSESFTICFGDTSFWICSVPWLLMSPLEPTTSEPTHSATFSHVSVSCLRDTEATTSDNWQQRLAPHCIVFQLRREHCRYGRGWISLSVCGGQPCPLAPSATQAETRTTACHGGTDPAVRAGGRGVVRHGHRSLLHLPSLPTWTCEYQPHPRACVYLQYLPQFHPLISCQLRVAALLFCFLKFPVEPLWSHFRHESSFSFNTFHLSLAVFAQNTS